MPGQNRADTDRETAEKITKRFLGDLSTDAPGALAAAITTALATAEEAARREEREACAQVATDIADEILRQMIGQSANSMIEGQEWRARGIAAAIRARRP